jgi:hypothetical protein
MSERGTPEGPRREEAMHGITRRIVVLLGAAAVSVSGVAPAGAKPPTPVEIDTVIDFSSFPFLGTFTVPEGASTLGCAGGTFVDLQRSEGVIGGAGVLEKHITCTSGAGAGDGFVLLFHHECTFLSRAVFLCRPGPGDLNGQWMVLDGTGFFAGLQGSGDISITFVDEVTGEEELVGGIHFG